MSKTMEQRWSLNAHEEAQEYEWRGDEGDYTPNERERLLLEDFGNGLEGRLTEIIEQALSSAIAERDEGIASVCDAKYHGVSSASPRSLVSRARLEGMAEAYNILARELRSGSIKGEK